MGQTHTVYNTQHTTYNIQHTAHSTQHTTHRISSPSLPSPLLNVHAETHSIHWEYIRWAKFGRSVIHHITPTQTWERNIYIIGFLGFKGKRERRWFMLYREWTDRGMDGECKREWTSLSYIQPISHLQKPINWPAMIEAISLMYSNPGCPAVAVGLALPKIITETVYSRKIYIECQCWEVKAWIQLCRIKHIYTIISYNI